MQAFSNQSEIIAAKDLAIDGVQYKKGTTLGRVTHVVPLDRLISGLHNGAVEARTETAAASSVTEATEPKPEAKTVAEQTSTN